MAVADTVVAGQVRRSLGRRDDVVSGKPVVGVRKIDVDDLRAGLRERRDRFPNSCLDPWLHALHEVLLRQAEANAAQSRRGLIVAGRNVSEVVGHGHRRRRRIALVAAGEGAHQQSCITDIAAKRSDLVKELANAMIP